MVAGQTGPAGDRVKALVVMALRQGIKLVTIPYQTVAYPVVVLPLTVGCVILTPPALVSRTHNSVLLSLRSELRQTLPHAQS